MKYIVVVEYRAGNIQTHEHLSQQQMVQATKAFLDDLVRLQGNGVTSLTVKGEQS